MRSPGYCVETNLRSWTIWTAARRFSRDTTRCEWRRIGNFKTTTNISPRRRSSPQRACSSGCLAKRKGQAKPEAAPLCAVPGPVHVVPALACLHSLASCTRPPLPTLAAGGAGAEFGAGSCSCSTSSAAPLPHVGGAVGPDRPRNRRISVPGRLPARRVQAVRQAAGPGALVVSPSL